MTNVVLAPANPATLPSTNIRLHAWLTKCHRYTLELINETPDLLRVEYEVPGQASYDPLTGVTSATSRRCFIIIPKEDVIILSDRDLSEED